MNEPQQGPSLAWTFPFILVIAVASIISGAYLAATGTGYALLAAGVVGVMIVLAAWPVTALLGSLARSNIELQRDVKKEIADRMQQMSITLHSMSEQQLLSDRAKSIAYRTKDRDALRAAIQEEMGRQDWEAALYLAGAMETAFGYKAEADRFRAEIMRRRAEHLRSEYANFLAGIDQLCAGEQWAAAQLEAQNLARQFPQAEVIRALPGEIETRRQQQKMQYLELWRTAVAARDAEGGMEILKRLDAYLTVDEGAALQEQARAIIKDKIGMLRDQFAAAVGEKKWGDAAKIADEVIRDFPNSRLAEEMRLMVDSLRTRAGGVGGIL